MISTFVPQEWLIKTPQFLWSNRQLATNCFLSTHDVSGRSSVTSNNDCFAYSGFTQSAGPSGPLYRQCCFCVIPCEIGNVLEESTPLCLTGKWIKRLRTTLFATVLLVCVQQSWTVLKASSDLLGTLFRHPFSFIRVYTLQIPDDDRNNTFPLTNTAFHMHLKLKFMH